METTTQPTELYAPFRRTPAAAPTPLDRLLRASDVSRMAGVTRQYVYEAAQRGDLPTYSGLPRRPYYFRRRDVQVWLERPRRHRSPGRHNRTA